jgi:hypothetical protein
MLSKPLLGERHSMMPKDLKELLRAFNEQKVKYLVVGGYAFGVYAEPRATKDLDLFIQANEENSKAVFRALAEYGALLLDSARRTFETERLSKLVNPRHV